MKDLKVTWDEFLLVVSVKYKYIKRLSSVHKVSIQIYQQRLTSIVHKSSWRQKMSSFQVKVLLLYNDCMCCWKITTNCSKANSMYRRQGQPWAVTLHQYLQWFTSMILKIEFCTLIICFNVTPRGVIGSLMICSVSPGLKESLLKLFLKPSTIVFICLSVEYCSRQISFHGRQLITNMHFKILTKMTSKTQNVKKWYLPSSKPNQIISFFHNLCV